LGVEEDHNRDHTCGTNLQAAKACFAELARCVNRQTKERVEPNVITCNAMITAYGNAGDLQGARDVFKDLLARGLEPDLYTYTAMIRAYGKAGDGPGAKAAFQNLLDRGLEPTVITCNALITAHGNVGDSLGAQAAFGDLVAREFRPDLYTCNAMCVFQRSWTPISV
jgi:pentatricopeptide repeat protein